MAGIHEITDERLKEVLDYDPTTGVFLWKKRLAKNVPVGSEAGKVNPRRYRYIKIDGCEYLAQRLAWFWVYGTWPRLIRFKDRDPGNLRIENLREGFYLDRKYDKHDPASKSAYDKEYKVLRADHIRSHRLKTEFGIDLEEYQRLFLTQNGVCDICAKPETEMRSNKVKWMAVDHNHTTGAVRGLLCTACNKMIGLAGDSKDTLAKAIKYLEKHEVAENVVPLFSENKS